MYLAAGLRQGPEWPRLTSPPSSCHGRHQMHSVRLLPIVCSKLRLSKYPFVSCEVPPSISLPPTLGGVLLYEQVGFQTEFIAISTQSNVHQRNTAPSCAIEWQS